MTATTASADARAPRLLVVRNDKLGDFMLAWPALAALKKAKPAPHVSVLVPAYTAPMARLCPWIDDVVIDPGEQAPKDAQRALLATATRCPIGNRQNREKRAFLWTKTQESACSGLSPWSPPSTRRWH